MIEQLDLEDRLSDHPKTLTEQWKKGELESGWYYVNFYSVGAVMQEYLYLRSYAMRLNSRNGKREKRSEICFILLRYKD